MGANAPLNANNDSQLPSSHLLRACLPEAMVKAKGSAVRDLACRFPYAFGFCGDSRVGLVFSGTSTLVKPKKVLDVTLLNLTNSLGSILVPCNRRIYPIIGCLNTSTAWQQLKGSATDANQTKLIITPPNKKKKKKNKKEWP